MNSCDFKNVLCGDKGFSGLLNETRSKTAKYQALNRLTLRGVWLMLEAFADEPPELIVFENVPRIALMDGWQKSAGAHLEMHVAHRVGMEIVIAREVEA